MSIRYPIEKYGSKIVKKIAAYTYVLTIIIRVYNYYIWSQLKNTNHKNVSQQLPYQYRYDCNQL